MSIWTEVAGIIYVDDWTVLDGSPKVDLHAAVRKGLPTGSEDGLTIAIAERDDRYKAITIFGAVRDMDAHDLHYFTEWWNNLNLGNNVRILMASIRLTCEEMDITLRERS